MDCLEDADTAADGLGDAARRSRYAAAGGSVRGDADPRACEPPPSTRAELVARLRASQGYMLRANAHASHNADNSCMDDRADAAAEGSANGDGGGKVTETGRSATGMRRRRRDDVLHLQLNGSAKKRHIDGLHDEFVCTEAACGVGTDNASGHHGGRRRGCVASSASDRVEHDSHSNGEGASGGATVGITATEVTTPNTVPSCATAVVGARCSEVKKVTSAAVPVRRRIVGKRRDPHPPVQPADVCTSTETLEESLRDDRVPLAPGRCRGLSGRPPEQSARAA